MTAAALLLAAASWPAFAAGAPRLPIDPLRVQPPALAAGSLHRLAGSFLARYEKDGMRLSYLVPGGDAALVERAFSRLKFKRVVVAGRGYAEGDLKTAGGASPLHLAAALAIERGIPVAGVEPSEGLVLRALLAEGYAAEDWAGWRFLSAAVDGRRDGFDPRAAFDALMPALAREAGLAKPPLDYAGFTAWYRAKNGAPFETDEIGPLTLKPDEMGPLYTQRLAHVAALARDRFAARRVADELLVYGDVLVVSGSDRFAAQRAAIEDALGPAVYVGSVVQ